MALHRAVGNSSCFNCRAKKVRCDRTLPRCWPCTLRDLECAAPEAPPRMIWLQPWVTDPESPSRQGNETTVDSIHVRRQLLFSRDEQAQNAADLLSLAVESCILPMLDELDQQSEGIQDGETVAHGPFHVFRYDIDTGMPASSAHSVAEDLVDFAEIDDWEFLTHELSQMEHENILQLPCSPFRIPDDDFTFTDHNLNIDGEQSEVTKTSVFALPPTIPSESGDDLADFSMSTAKSLLDHYRNTMMSFFTPARAERRSPWEALYIPSIMGTLGDISLAGNSGNAKVSLLFAIFAISAYSMASLYTSCADQNTQDWYALGELYKGKATKRLKLSLRDLSVRSSKKEKYKDILMPLLSMVTISVVSGDMKNATLYLRDIEQFINLHGMPKKHKSRKVKMLHSIYLYLQALTETANLQDRTWNAEPHGEQLDSPDINSSGQVSRWDQLLGVQPGSRESAASDPLPALSVQKTTFEEIYSVPQSLFKLILQTTHQAAEVEKLRATGHPLSTDHDAFACNVKELEDRICTWEHYYHDAVLPLDPTNSPPRENFPYHLVQAVYSALLIYFYRSVRDVNAILLQPYVHQTIHHLLEYDKQKERCQDQSANTCWPGFIAGCESTKPQYRRQISEWLERSAQVTGIRMFAVALQAVQKVWNARSLPGNQNVSWHCALREFGDFRVLVLS